MSLTDFLTKERLNNSSYGVPFPVRSYLNHSITPSFSTFPTEQRDTAPTAILFKGIAYFAAASLATFTPTEIKGQVVQDTIPTYTLPELFVNPEIEKIPEDVLSAISRRDPNLALYFEVPEINSLVPGLSNMPYEHIPGGSVIYIHNVLFVGRADLNNSMTDPFSTFPTKQINRVSTAIMPSVDIPLEMLTTRDEESFFVNVQPFQLSGGLEYSSDRFRVGGSAQILNVPSVLPRGIRRPLKVLGEGARAHVIGEFKTREQDGTRFSLEGYGIDLRTDFREGFGASKFQADDGQGFIIGHVEHPLSENRTLEFTTSLQFGSSDLKIQDHKGGEITNTYQDIRLFTTRTDFDYSSGSFGIAFHDLEKTNILRDEKAYSIFQFSADKFYSLPLDLMFRTNGRVDFISGMEGLPEFSVYGTLERAFSNLTFRISRARLHDAILPEILKSPLVVFFPSSDTEVQDIDYDEVSLEARVRNHTLRATAGRRSMNMTLSVDASIEGSYYTLGYMWSGENSFVTINTTSRRMKMYMEGEPDRNVPGSPGEELKVIGGRNWEDLSLGASMAIQGSSSFPLNTGRNLEFIELGRRIILNPYFSATKGRFSLGLNLVNSIELLERIGLIDDFSNALAVYGKDRDFLEMPWFVYFNLEFRP